MTTTLTQPTTQRRQPPHITPRANTHGTFPSNSSPFPDQTQAGFIPYGTWAAQEYLDKFVLHDVNMFARQEMSQGTCTLPLIANQGRLYREHQLNDRSLSERESRQETEREIKSETDRQTERQTDRQTVCPRRSRVHFQNASMCAVNRPCLM